jgi:hypothetical protein
VTATRGGAAITKTQVKSGRRLRGQHVSAWSVAAILIIVAGIVAASLYGLIAAHPYRSLPHETVVAARAQDVCSVLVAALLLLLARNTSARAHLIRLGLLAYVAYSYAIYLTGVPMNRIFLVYVVVVTTSGAAFLHGLLRLRPSAWPRITSRRLERGTGWMLVVVALLFAALWLSVLLPYAFGGSEPSPRGPGGVAYPVFILDLVVALPCIAAVGVLLLRGQPIAGPLAAVALIKIVTLFAALWTGVVVAFVEDGHVTLGIDTGPGLLLLVVSTALVRRWLGSLSPDPDRYVRPSLWADGATTT